MPRIHNKFALILGIPTILLAIMPPFAGAQDVISTFAGGGPNSMPATTANVQYPVQSAVDRSGNFYFVSDYQYQHRVFKVSTSGELSIVAGDGTAGYSGDGAPATRAELYNPAQVATDSEGNVYIADYDNCLVRKVTVSTGIISTFAGSHTAGCGYGGDGGGATTAKLNYPTGVAVDSSGNVYIADYYNYRVRKVSASTGDITTVAGDGTPGFSGDGGPATSAELDAPRTVAVDGSGNVYIADFSNYRIRKVTVSTGKISTVAGNGTAGSSGDGGLAIDAKISAVYEVASDASGNIFIADTNNCVIREVTASSGKISTVAGDHTCTYSGDGSAATSAALYYPYGVAVDSSDNLYIADYYSYRVRKVTHSSGVINTVAGNGVFYYAGNGTSANGASLYYPWNATPDSSGNVYIADRYNCLVRKVNSSGIITVLAGIAPSPSSPSAACGYSGDGGPATSARLNNPLKAIADSSGNVYISDYDNCVIREVAASTGEISTFAGTGSCGYSGDGGAPRSAQLYLPIGITLDSSNNMYIADSGNNVVRKISGGIVTTVAGNHTKGAGFSGDGGPASSAQLNTPYDVAVDFMNNLYIADFYNLRVRVVNPSRIISTFAGNGASGYEGDGGLATDTSIYYPASVAVDPAADVIIGDYYNYRVRWVGQNGIIQTVAGDGAYGYSGDSGPGPRAELTYPTGVGVDKSGNIYVADYYNWRIREITAIPNLNSSTFNINYEEQPLGTTSNPQEITLTATGGLAISSIATTGDFAEADDCPSSLSSGSNCNVDITFTPSGVGTRTGTLVVTTNGLFNPTVVVNLKGTGEGLAYAPAELNFGSHVVGGTSTAQTITFTNDSSSSVTFSSVTSTKTTFAVSSNTCTGSIASGKTCTIGVTFKPTASGAAAASLVVKDTDTTSPQLIPLRGTGIGTSLSPASLSFGSVTDGSSHVLSTTLTNKGTASLTSISASVTGSNGSNFTFTTTCGTTLSNGASCTYSVTFKPTGSGTESAVLNVKDDEGTFHVSLTGTAVL